MKSTADITAGVGMRTVLMNFSVSDTKFTTDCCVSVVSLMRTFSYNSARKIFCYIQQLQLKVLQR